MSIKDSWAICKCKIVVWWVNRKVPRVQNTKRMLPWRLHWTNLCIFSTMIYAEELRVFTKELSNRCNRDASNFRNLNSIKLIIIIFGSAIYDCFKLQSSLKAISWTLNSQGSLGFLFCCLTQIWNVLTVIHSNAYIYILFCIYVQNNKYTKYQCTKQCNLHNKC